MIFASFVNPKVLKAYNDFLDYRRSAAQGAIDAGDFDAADMEAFFEVVGPLIDRSATEGRAAA